MAARRLTELDRRERRRRTVRAAGAVLLAWVFLLTGYYLLPMDVHSGATAVLRFAISIALFVLALAAQIRHITTADLPVVRAAQALGVVIPLFLVVFSAAYLSLAHGSSTHFNAPLDHTAALYFTITVLATVGFGDITPVGDLARLFVSVQMLLDLVLFGTLVRLLTSVTRSALQRGEAPGDAGAQREP